MIKSLYSKVFAKYYDSFISSFEAKIKRDRKNMLGKLNGVILDVGSGTGVNFEFFNNHVKVFAVEPSKSMLKKSIIKVRNKI